MRGDILQMKMTSIPSPGADAPSSPKGEGLFAIFIRESLLPWEKDRMRGDILLTKMTSIPAPGADAPPSPQGRGVVRDLYPRVPSPLGEGQDEGRHSADEDDFNPRTRRGRAILI